MQTLPLRSGPCGDATPISRRGCRAQSPQHLGSGCRRPAAGSGSGAVASGTEAGKVPRHSDVEGAAPMLTLTSSPSDGRAMAGETPQHTGLHPTPWTKPWLTAPAGTTQKPVFPQATVFSPLKRVTLQTNERTVCNNSVEQFVIKKHTTRYTYPELFTNIQQFK